MKKFILKVRIRNKTQFRFWRIKKDSWPLLDFNFESSVFKLPKTSERDIHYHPAMQKIGYTFIEVLFSFLLSLRAEIDLSVMEMGIQYEKIRKDFDQSVADMLGIISILNKNNNSPSLYQLLLRFDYNGHYSHITNESFQ